MSDKITVVLDDKRAAKIEWDKHSCQFLVMNNGFQWSGASIYSLETAKAARDVLNQYIEIMDAEKGD